MSEKPTRVGHVAIHLGSCIVVIGGTGRISSPTPVNVIWLYNLYMEQWRLYVIPITGKNTVPPITLEACAVAILNDIYMFGRKNLLSRATNALWKLT